MAISGIALVLRTLDKENQYAKGYFKDEMKMYRGPLRSLQGRVRARPLLRQGFYQRSANPCDFSGGIATGNHARSCIEASLYPRGDA